MLSSRNTRRPATVNAMRIQKEIVDRLRP